MEKPGIYQVESLAEPGKIYVFLAVDICAKWQAELAKLSAGIHENKKLQQHFDFYGRDDLRHSLVEAVSKDKWMKYLECYIQTMQPYFNISDDSNELFASVYTDPENNAAQESPGSEIESKDVPVDNVSTETTSKGRKRNKKNESK